MRHASYSGQVLRARLKQDIVIPAGTIFDLAPDTLQCSRNHIETIVGLTPDSSGHFIYGLEGEGLPPFFEVVESDEHTVALLPPDLQDPSS